MASNATFIAENTELNESLLLGIKRVGLDNWECNLPWATLSDLTSTLTAASVAATPSLTRGSVYQVSRASAGIRVKVEIQWLGTQSVGSFFTVFADELADLISVLTAVASETDEPIDLDGGASGKINEQQLPSYLQQSNLEATIGVVAYTQAAANTQFAPGVSPAAVTRPGRFDPSRSVYNLGARHLRKTRAALGKARAGTGLFRMLCIGDSITAGQGAVLASQSWPVALRNRLAASMTVGTGVVLGSNVGSGIDTRWAYTGSWSVHATPSAHYMTSTAGAKATFTSDVAGTVVEVVYGLASTSGGFTISIDGGAPVTQTFTGGQADTVYAVTGLPDTTHTVTITVNSGTFYLTGAGVRSASGAYITNAGLGGATAAQWARTETYLAMNALTALTPTLTFIALGTNDANQSLSVTTFGNNIQALIDKYKPLGDVVLGVMPPAVGPTLTTYIAKIYELADTNDLPVLDMFDRHGSGAEATANGVLTDWAHMTPAGYADYADAILAAIESSGVTTPAPSVTEVNAANTIVLVGDSLTAYNGGQSISTPVQSMDPTILDGKGMHNWANVFLGHDLIVLGNAAIGGQEASQIRARFESDVLAYEPAIVSILAGSNDEPEDGTVADLLAMYTAARDAGCMVLAHTIPPSTSYSTGQETSRLKVNEWIRSFATSTPGVVLADIAAAWQDPSLSGFKVNAAYVHDGVHPSVAGAQVAGRIIADALRPFVPRNRIRATAQGAPFNMLGNPHFLGSIVNVNASTNTLGAINIIGTGLTLSVGERTDGYAGKELTVVVPADGNFSITSNVTIDGTSLAVGDLVEFLVEIEVSGHQAASATGRYIGATIQQYTGSTFADRAHDIYRDGGAAYGLGTPMPNGIYGLRTPPRAVTSGKTLVQIVAGGTGGGTYKVRGAALRNLTKIAAA